jgi:hypothetical protein
MIASALLVTWFAGVTVEDRLFAISDRVMVVASASLLDRNDLLISPGIGVVVTHYLDDTFGVDYLLAQHFWTRERAAARQLREEVGYRPNRDWPSNQLMAGVRYAFGYGKLLMQPGGAVLHFIPELGLHGGVVLADAGAGARGAWQMSLAVRTLVAQHLLALVEIRLLASFEREGLVVGTQPALGAGVMW